MTTVHSEARVAAATCSSCASAADAPSLGQVEDVVARHLERFAFRDQPEITWSRGAS